MNNPFFLKREDGSAHGGARITAATHLPRVMTIDESVLLAAHLVNLADISIPVFAALFSKLFHHDKPAAVPAAPAIAAAPAPPAAPAAPAPAPAAAAADKPADKTADKSAEKPAPAPVSADKPADKPADKK